MHIERKNNNRNDTKVFKKGTSVHCGLLQSVAKNQEQAATATVDLPIVGETTTPV